MYYDIHTHFRKPRPDVMSIENRYKHFDEEILGHGASLGLHPWFLDVQNLDGEWGAMVQNAGNDKVLAIGECGLDKLTATDWNLQLDVFRRQIALAQQLSKPLMIHCVKAFNETLKELEHVTVPVIFHGINNKLSLVRPVVEAGYYLSFGKSLLRGQAYLLETFRAVPPNQVFLETDDADIDIMDVYKSAAEIKNLPEKEIVLQLEKNFLNVFQ